MELRTFLMPRIEVCNSLAFVLFRISKSSTYTTVNPMGDGFTNLPGNPVPTTTSCTITDFPLRTPESFLTLENSIFFPPKK